MSADSAADGVAPIPLGTWVGLDGDVDVGEEVEDGVLPQAANNDNTTRPANKMKQYDFCLTGDNAMKASL